MVQVSKGLPFEVGLQAQVGDEGAALLCYAVTAFFSVACCITGVYLWLLLAMLAPKEK